MLRKAQLYVGYYIKTTLEAQSLQAADCMQGIFHGFYMKKKPNLKSLMNLQELLSFSYHYIYKRKCSYIENYFINIQK